MPLSDPLVVELFSEYEPDLLGVPGRIPLLSWSVAGANREDSQSAAELQVSTSADFSEIFSTSTIEDSASQFIPAPGGEIASRQIRFYRVRIEASAIWSEWSNPLRLEAGLLEPSEFVGQAIGNESKAQGPATLLRRKFEVKKVVAKARLYATAHGVFNLYLNGEKVGNEHLAPGWTTYQKRILTSTYDVTNQINSGQNALGVMLGDGWFRGKFGFLNLVNNYGDQSAFLGQLELTYLDGTVEIIATDDSWLAGNGAVRMGSIYDGCDIDFNFNQPNWHMPEFDESGWTAAVIRPFDKSVLEPRAAAPVRTIAEFSPTISRHKIATRVDLGQNISGWLRIKISANAGAKVAVRHAEVLEPNGDLHTAALRGARAIDTYLIAEAGELSLEPELTFHGFQFADIEIEGDAEVLEVTGVAISSENKIRGSFESSNSLLNRLHNNTKWSLLDNFVSIPTDCPQRDERLGWTGDAQAFAYAAHSLVDGYGFFKSWLVDLALEQETLGGKVPVVVPDLLTMQLEDDSPFVTSYGYAGWSDAATVVPWSIYERFGDKAILKQQLQSMRAWVEHNRSDHEGLLIPDRMQLGDWLDPDAPEGQPWAAKVSGRFMANAYMAHSVDLLARAEAVLGNHDEASALQTRLTELKSAIWAELAAAAIQTTTGASILLEFDLAPEDQRAEVAANLARQVRDTGARISTGFLGTPVILDALSRNGYVEEAYAMLLRTEMRSWLYPITKGATTIWERWEAILEDGTISGGSLDDQAEGSGEGMLSFNHYAYGAVVDWMHRNVGGISPLDPGYRRVSIQPLPQTSLTACKSSIETGLGQISLDWRVLDESLIAELTVPFGMTAVLNLPASPDSVLSVDGTTREHATELSHGSYKIKLSHPLVII
jgi:alpha-L-rhamnosidase